MQIAATLGIDGSAGSGRIPFWQRAWTLPGVSFPSRVVRSIMRMARSSAHSLLSRLMDRFARLPTRSTTRDLVDPADPAEPASEATGVPVPRPHERLRLVRRPFLGRALVGSEVLDGGHDPIVHPPLGASDRSDM